MSTSRTLEVDGLEVELVRGDVRRVNLRVRPDGSVRLSAPSRVPADELARFVRAHRAWVDGCLERNGLRDRAERERWQDGGALDLLGERVALRVEPAAGRHTQVERVAGELVVRPHAPRSDDLGKPGLADWRPAGEELRQLLLPWLKGELREAALPLLERRQEEMGVRCSQLRVRWMSSRWGSCNVRTGAITLNAELALRPEACLDAVVCHELCHLLEPSHGARFYALMDRWCPGWPEARAVLRESPPMR